MNFYELLERKGIRYEKRGDAVVINGSLDLRGCTGLTALPDNLMADWLYLSGCTGLTALPDNLMATTLYLNGCTGLKNVVYKQNCGDNNREIYAAVINGKIKIGAGCFLGSIDEFYKAVDEKYRGKNAERYKQDAMECVRELKGN